jgi:hypothetical protein
MRLRQPGPHEGYLQLIIIVAIGRLEEAPLKEGLPLTQLEKKGVYRVVVPPPEVPERSVVLVSS